eukprot:5332817-Pleurochrysis_carterae.AAC.2
MSTVPSSSPSFYPMHPRRNPREARLPTSPCTSAEILAMHVCRNPRHARLPESSPCTSCRNPHLLGNEQRVQLSDEHLRNRGGNGGFFRVGKKGRARGTALPPCANGPAKEMSKWRHVDLTGLHLLGGKGDVSGPSRRLKGIM